MKFLLCFLNHIDHQISYTIRDAILIAIKNLIEKYFYKFDSSSSSSDFDNNIDYQDEHNTTIYFNNSIKHDENQINYPIAVRNRTVNKTFIKNRDYFFLKV